MTQKKGLYVIFEGPDGSGKSTQADYLTARLEAEGRNPLRIDEPSSGSNPFGKLLRELLKSGEYPESHAALFLADRMALQTRVVIPALEAGRPVISSRSFISTLVYQQEHWPLDWLFDLHEQLPAKPTHLVQMDLDAKVSVERVGKRKSLEVYETEEILTRVRARYLKLFSDLRLMELLGPNHKAILVDGHSPIEENHELIWNFINRTSDA